jgi:hypothetical protein
MSAAVAIHLPPHPQRTAAMDCNASVAIAALTASHAASATRESGRIGGPMRLDADPPSVHGEVRMTARELDADERRIQHLIRGFRVLLQAGQTPAALPMVAAASMGIEEAVARETVELNGSATSPTSAGQRPRWRRR